MLTMKPAPWADFLQDLPAVVFFKLITIQIQMAKGSHPLANFVKAIIDIITIGSIKI